MQQIAQKALISTISPIRTPLNLDSEAMSGNPDMGTISSFAHQQGWNGLFPEPAHHEDLDWTYGYSSLESDQIPHFYQPVFVLDIRDMLADREVSSSISAFCKQYDVDLSCAKIFLYDDTISLLRVDFDFHQTRFDALETHYLLDQDLSGLIRCLYALAIYPYFCECAERSEFIKIVKENTTLLGPASFRTFNDLKFASKKPAPADGVLWTGRSLIAENAFAERYPQIFQWASCEPGDLKNFSTGRAFFSSGNNLIITDATESAITEFFRAAAPFQMYTALMTIMTKKMKKNYLLLSTSNTESQKYRDIVKTIQNIKRDLDHLDFADLEFGEMVLGTQSDRGAIQKCLLDAWGIEALRMTTSKRATSIRARLEQLTERRRNALVGTVESILAFIGGIALIDLFLGLSVSSREVTIDSVWGLMDLFRSITPDTSLWISIAAVLGITVLVYKSRR